MAIQEILDLPYQDDYSVSSKADEFVFTAYRKKLKKMATYDVPGANPVHNDELGVGNWAEHNDGSLILINSLNDERVIFSIFDMIKGVEHRSTMPVDEFNRQFSMNLEKQPGELDDKWLWHDKTEFPWDRLFDPSDMKLLPDNDASLAVTIERSEVIATSVADRISNKINTQVAKLDPEQVKKKSNGVINALKAWFS